jgi:signal transduction histidine kinase
VCAYRIVQESLSNASRHAPGAPVRVTIGHDHDAVQLRVENGPPALNGHDPLNGNTAMNGNTAVNRRFPANGHRVADGAGPAGGPGHGLAGMRERVGLLGGSLSAGPSPDGGFMVSAVIPFTEARVTA